MRRENIWIEIKSDREKIFGKIWRKKPYGLTTQLLDEGRLRYAINNLNKDNKKNQDTSGEMGVSWLGGQVLF